MGRIKIVFVLLFICCTALFTQTNDLPRSMFVIARSGLNYREAPTVESRRLGTYLYGQGISIIEQGPRETIDGISSYWYKTSFKEWVFGGYLADDMPGDTPIVLGLWDDKDRDYYVFYFRPDHSYREGIRESGIGYGGTWALNGTTITLVINQVHTIDDDVPELVFNVELIITDRNNISLLFPNGERANLARSYNYW